MPRNKTRGTSVGRGMPICSTSISRLVLHLHGYAPGSITAFCDTMTEHTSTILVQFGAAKRYRGHVNSLIKGEALL